MARGRWEWLSRIADVIDVSSVVPEWLIRPLYGAVGFGASAVIAWLGSFVSTLDPMLRLLIAAVIVACLVWIADRVHLALQRSRAPFPATEQAVASPDGTTIIDRPPVARPLPSKPLLFSSQGFLWELTHNFWPLARSFDPENALSMSELIGPLCPNRLCLLGVGEQLKAHKSECPKCGTRLSPDVPIVAENKPGILSSRNSDPLWPLKMATYIDAQAAMRRNEINERTSLEEMDYVGEYDGSAMMRLPNGKCVALLGEAGACYASLDHNQRRRVTAAAVSTSRKSFVKDEILGWAR